MQIFINIGRTLTINVEPSYTIKEVKYIIQNTKGIIFENQRFISFNGKILKDDLTLADYNIKKLSTLCLSLCSDPLHMYCDSKCKCLCNYCYIIYDDNKKLKLDQICFDCCTTLYLKNKIRDELNIDNHFQQLSMNGKIFKDNQKLKINGVCSGTEIELKIIMTPSEFKKLNNLNKEE